MYEQITSNKRRSIALFAGFLLLYGLIAVGLYLSMGIGWSIGIVVFALVVSLTALLRGEQAAVRIAGGRRIERKEEAPELWRLVENLSIVAGVPMPKLYIASDPSPNAFAAGRSPESAIVCVNQGLLELLDKQELEGVIAHELAHIRNYDVRLMTYASILAGSIVLIAQLAARATWLGAGGRNRGGGSSGGGPAALIGVVILLATVILAPLAASAIKLAISRRREFVADASAAELTRYPQALASALQQISSDQTVPTHAEEAIAHMMISPPLGLRGKERQWLSTHPPASERIAALMEMAGGVPHQRGLPVTQTFLEAPAP